MQRDVLSRQVTGRCKRARVLSCLPRRALPGSHCPSQFLLGFLPHGDKIVGYTLHDLAFMVSIEIWALDIAEANFSFRLVAAIPISQAPLLGKHAPLTVLFSKNEHVCLAYQTLPQGQASSAIVFISDEHHPKFKRSFALLDCSPTFQPCALHLTSTSSAAAVSVCAFEFGKWLEFLYIADEMLALRCNQVWWSSSRRRNKQEDDGLFQLMRLDAEAYLLEQLPDQLEETDFAILDYAIRFVRFPPLATTCTCTFEFITVAKVRLVQQQRNVFVGLTAQVSLQAHCLLEVVQQRPTATSSSSCLTKCNALVEQRRAATSAHLCATSILIDNNSPRSSRLQSDALPWDIC